MSSILLKYSHVDNISDPFCTYNQIPLPSPYSPFDCANEPAFIRKRNERERERVRCVNEGYARLRQHLPLDKRDKRISKVETLRAAISYIHHLQTVLTDLDEVEEENTHNNSCPSNHTREKTKRKIADENDSDISMPAKHRKMTADSSEISKNNNKKSVNRMDLRTNNNNKNDIYYGSLKRSSICTR